MLEGVDYSDARPGGAHLAQQGKRFAVRYLYPGGQKGLTPAEVHDLSSHGIGIPVVFEGGAGGAKQGHGQGVADAHLAQAQLDTLPLDHRLPIYFAVDFDINGGNTADATANRAAVLAYLEGVASVIGLARTGVYGGYDTIEFAVAHNAAVWLWQSYAWSAGRVFRGIHLFQYANGQWGGSVDFCRALQAEYGQHAPAAPNPVPTHPAAVAAPIEEDPMPVYFKGDRAADVFYLNRATGTKRHVTAAEWAAVNAGQSIVTIAQAEADAIPTA